jgi:hypothetical protein
MLKGAPGDTPAQQPTSARAGHSASRWREIGVEIPPAILARADEVIDEAPRADAAAERRGVTDCLLLPRRALPIVAFLSPTTFAANIDAFRRGLRELG